ncbi:oxidoreductase [Lentibacillus populi]|uniref:Oxidoreductase n=1 Tax=Lentibacillus populi TaxID=1827502 RepID=A0A9W5X5P7_9BACI|nr:MULTISPECIES: FAD-binding oxidoreductase [Bacillaceae]GGB45733.1 oxidoreductase [Lentibacillus populi]
MKIIVVGSGVVGASSAYQLVKSGHEVILIDKEHKGAATAAGAGIVCPWVSSVKDDDWYRIAKGGAQFYPRLIDQLKNDGEENVGYKKVGALCISSDPDELHTIEKEINDKYENAPEIGDVQRLTAKEACELFPPLNAQLEAIFISGAARVDGKLLRDAMIRAAKKHGAKVLHGEASLIKEQDVVTGVKFHHETIHADTVLIAAGAWASALLEPIGIDVKVEPQRGQIAHIKLPDADTSNWPVVLPESSHYMLAFDDSRVVAGATRETGSGFDYQATVGGINEVLTNALTVAPGLANGTIQEVRIGFRPMGPDVLPLLGTFDSVKRVVVATGLGASGLTMGPYVGALAASIAEGKKVDVDLTAYRPERG